jgi:hypothetical protein
MGIYLGEAYDTLKLVDDAIAVFWEIGIDELSRAMQHKEKSYGALYVSCDRAIGCGASVLNLAEKKLWEVMDGLKKKRGNLLYGVMCEALQGAADAEEIIAAGFPAECEAKE